MECAVQLGISPHVFGPTSDMTRLDTTHMEGAELLREGLHVA